MIHPAHNPSKKWRQFGAVNSELHNTATSRTSRPQNLFLLKGPSYRKEKPGSMTDMTSSAPEVSTTSAAPLPTAPVNTIQAVR